MKSLIRGMFGRTCFLFVLVFAGLAFQFNSVTRVGAAGGHGDTSRADTTVAEDLFAGLKWRNIGPFHGGRISAISGAIGEGQ